MAGDRRVRSARRVAAGRAPLVLAGGVALLVAAGAPADGERATGAIVGAVVIDGVSGTAMYAGPPPSATPIDMAADAYCRQANEGRTVFERTVVADAEGRLADVVVYVVEAPTGGSAPAPAPAVLDQQNCLYAPRTVAVRTNEPLTIRNSDATLHNVHVKPQRNRSFNLGQPIKGLESRRSFTQAEVGIPVACDIHGWMRATISVFDHPYYAVTGEDGGFSIAGLPPGTYTLEAWHAELGPQRQSITVVAGQTASATFRFGSTETPRP